MDSLLSLSLVPVLLDILVVAALSGMLLFGQVTRRWRTISFAMIAVFSLHLVESLVETPLGAGLPDAARPMIQSAVVLAYAGVAYLVRHDVLSERRLLEQVDQRHSPTEGANDEAPVVVIQLTRAGTIRSINKRGLELLGGRSDRYVGKDAFDIVVAPEDRDEARRGFAGFIESGGLSHSHTAYLVLTPDGERLMRWTRSAQYDRSGEIVGVISYGEDITELKLTQEALERYRVLATQARDIIMFVRDSDGRILEANDAAVAAYGYPRDELLTLSIFDLRSDTAETVRQDMQVAAQGGITFETVHRRADGSPFPVEVSSQGTTSIGDQTVFLSIIRDVTDRKRSERELEEYRARLRGLAERLDTTAENERRRLAAEIHDRVSQPLAAAKIRLEVMLRKQPEVSRSPEFEESIQLLTEAIKESRAITSEMRPPLLYDVGLRAALEWLADEQRRHGLDCEVDCSVEDVEDEDVKTFIFRTARELLINVTKHSGSDHARLSVRAVGEDIELVVKDNGHGFDTASLGQPSGNERGFGLFSIAEQAAGLRAFVDVRSEIGMGTTTTVRVAAEKREPAISTDGAAE